MSKKVWAAAALAVALFMSVGCVTLQEQYKNRVENSADRPIYSAFYPSPFGEKSAYDVSVYDETIRVTRRFATVDMIGEAERRYLAVTGSGEKDPVLEIYLGVAAKRGSVVKAYKGILNQRLFAMPGVTDFWPEYRKMSKEDTAYLEFDGAGRLHSALIRRAAFSNGSLGIGVYSENFVLTGSLIRSIENRISNQEMEDAFLRVVRPSLQK